MNKKFIVISSEKSEFGGNTTILQEANDFLVGRKVYAHTTKLYAEGTALDIPMSGLQIVKKTSEQTDDKGNQRTYWKLESAE